MRAALVPIRSVVGAKKRLASCLTLDERRELAVAMLADMVGALAASESLERVVVVSPDRALLERAGALGADILLEPEAAGLNHAVTWASRTLEAEGVTRLLTIPGDVPMLEPADVDRLLRTDAHDHPVVLVPSASGTGTNGLLTSPPTCITSRFEGDSLAAHIGACRRAGIEALVLDLPSFALDIDTPADLERLADRGGDRRAARLGVTALDFVRSRLRPPPSP